MTRTGAGSTPSLPVEPGGPLVAVCAGRRCAALRERTGRVEDLRSAIRRTPGGVLVATDCLGPCHLASLAVVARRDGATGTSGPSSWLFGIDQPTRATALREWVLDGGPTRHDSSPALPSALAEAVVALVVKTGRSGGGQPPP